MNQKDLKLIRYTRPHPDNEECFALAPDAPPVEEIGASSWNPCSLGTAGCYNPDHAPGSSKEVQRANQILAKNASPQDGGCLLWVGAIAPFFMRGRRDPRYIAWYAAHGEPPPKRARVHQTCGNQSCVAGGHLTLDRVKTVEDEMRRQVEGYGDRDAHWFCEKNLVYDGEKQTATRRAVFEAYTGEAYLKGMVARCGEDKCLNPHHGSHWFYHADVVDAPFQYAQTTSTSSGWKRLPWPKRVDLWVSVIRKLVKNPPAKPGEAPREPPQSPGVDGTPYPKISRVQLAEKQRQRAAKEKVTAKEKAAARRRTAEEGKLKAQLGKVASALRTLSPAASSKRDAVARALCADYRSALEAL